MSMLVSLLGSIGGGGGGGGDVTAAGDNTFTGINTFNKDTGTIIVNLLASDAQLGDDTYQGSLTFGTGSVNGGNIFISATPNNSGASIEITNAPVSQFTELTYPDTGTGAANFVLSEGAAIINGAKTFGSIPIGTAQVITMDLPTITAIAGAAKILFVAPFAGTITSGKAAVDAAFTATDITIALRVGTNAVTNGSMTIATSGSAFGSKATCTPSAANTFAVGDVVNATITGGVGTAGGVVNIYVTRTS